MRALGFALLAACSSPKRAAPRDAAPFTPRPVDAAQPLAIVDEMMAFDFRRVPLEPETSVGKEEHCLVDAIEAHEGSTLLTCRGNHAIAKVEVDGAVTTARDQMLRLRIDAAGAPPVHARATFRAIEGRLPDPEPPDRCDCHDDREDPEPPPPVAFDFSKIRADQAWGQVKVCDVDAVREVYRVDLDSPLDPLKARFGVEVYCGDERVEVGSESAVNLLAIRQGQYIAIEPVWMGHDVPPTAMFHYIERDVPERH